MGHVGFCVVWARNNLLFDRSVRAYNDLMRAPRKPSVSVRPKMWRGPRSLFRRSHAELGCVGCHGQRSIRTVVLGMLGFCGECLDRSRLVPFDELGGEC